MDVDVTNQEGGSRRSYEVRVLGCKVNAYEAQQLERTLELNGMRPADADTPADVVVVHSCAVTREAVRKSRQTVRRLQKQNPNARVIVTGCAASEDLLSTLEGVDARIGPRKDWLSGFQEEIGGTASVDDHLPVLSFRGHARAFLKIQDGCDIGCSFCIVPRLRRAPRDKAPEDVVKEATALALAGHRELVVSGVSVGLYGMHGGPNLAEVVRRLIDVEGIDRIRISSLHPREVTDELLDVWASSPKMMPHLHLPLQSGSDVILKAMRRSYTSAEFLDAVDRAQSALDQPAINADVIVGFPGETEADFEETVRVSRAAGFSRMHVFPYSDRPHTRAARLPDRVDGAVAKERCARLRKEAGELSLSFHRNRIGTRAEVLTEHWHPESGQYEGYDERYVPVRFDGPAGLRGQIVPVEHSEAWPDRNVARYLAPMDAAALGR